MSILNFIAFKTYIFYPARVSEPDLSLVRTGVAVGVAVIVFVIGPAKGKAKRSEQALE